MWIVMSHFGMHKLSNKFNALFMGTAIVSVAILPGVLSGKLRDGLSRVYSSKNKKMIHAYYNQCTPAYTSTLELIFSDNCLIDRALK